MLTTAKAFTNLNWNLKTKLVLGSDLDVAFYRVPDLTPEAITVECTHNFVKHVVGFI
jgi:hypothetical protein